MGCLVLLILAFIFRGAIVAALGALFAVFAALLSVGVWGLVLLTILCLIVAAFA